jgi:(2Fe-2S) ferredoxin
MPSVIYGNVNEKVVEEIIQKHLIGKELLSGYILDRPAIDIINK